MTVEGAANAAAQLTLKPSRSPVAGENLAAPLAFSGGGLVGEDFNLALDGSPTGVALSEHTVAFTGRGRTSTTTLILSAANDDDAPNKTVTVAIPSPSSGDGTDDDTVGVTLKESLENPKELSQKTLTPLLQQGF